MNGVIFNIQRFSIKDGTGIRTTVFLKGCPLKCQWCHNPESQEIQKSLFFDNTKCIKCGVCEKVCKHNAHKIEKGLHTIDRSKCFVCDECSDVCFANALELCGKNISAEDVIAEVQRDTEFYKASGGGMTISGGEPLFQADFSIELARLAKEKNINVAVETSGFGDTEKLMKLAEYTDCFLYDIKLFDEAEHIKYTGVSNKIILHNMDMLYQSGASIVLRCPVIPDLNFNMKHFENIKELMIKMPKISEVNLEPYHPLGIDKANRLGKKQKYDNSSFLDARELGKYVQYLNEYKAGICKAL